ncbi:MAG: aminopeptidase [Phycisphaerae bacterium]
MMRCTTFVALGCALVLGILATPAVAPGGERSQDFKAAADRVVATCADIQEGELVLIRGPAADLKFLEDMAVKVRQRGAFPLLSVTSDELVRRYCRDVPSKYITQAPQFDLKLAGMVDAAILVWAAHDPALLADVPAERVAAVHKSFQTMYDLMLTRNVRLIGLGNGIYPTAALARQFGMDKERLADIFFEGINVGQRDIQAAAENVKRYLSSGNSVRITTPDGTDLKMRIGQRPVYVNDGVIAREDARLGGAAAQTWLPAGEVFLAPEHGTAEGVVVVDRHVFQGQEIRGLKLEFEKGRLISMTARSGLQPLKKFYEACGDGKDRFAAIDIGVNPKVRIPANSKMKAWMASGMVTLGVGGNTWAGGDNRSEFELFTHLPQATLAVDGRKLVEKGALKP